MTASRDRRASRRFSGVVLILVSLSLPPLDGALAETELTDAELRGKQIFFRGTSGRDGKISAIVGDEGVTLPGSALPCRRARPTGRRRAAFRYPLERACKDLRTCPRQWPQAPGLRRAFIWQGFARGGGSGRQQAGPGNAAVRAVRRRPV